jgi:hypothetical protein
MSYCISKYDKLSLFQLDKYGIIINSEMQLTYLYFFRCKSKKKKKLSRKFISYTGVKFLIIHL